MKNIAIIGAGFSAITVAKLLEKHAKITLFEKSRGVSGRVATRRAEPYHFDHGAQFFYAKNEKFKSLISALIDKGIIARWDARFVEFTNTTITLRRQWHKSYPHYIGVPGMNSIAKYLSQDLTIKLNSHVQSLVQSNNQWTLKDKSGNSLGIYDWVISTVPAQQALELVPKSLSYYPKILDTKLSACFSLMLGFETPLPLEFDAALIRDEDISWISVNSSKPGRNTPYTLLIHSTNDWADQHIDDNKQSIIEYLCSQTSKVIGHDVSKAIHKDVHRWRFANIAKQTGATHFLDTQQQIGLCGDWFIQGRIEAAFTSGFDLVKKLIKVLK